MKKLGVIFGGMSTENKVSCVSGASVIKNLNKEKYEIYPIFIDENGKWFQIQMPKEGQIKIEKKAPIENVFEYLKQMDVIFPVLHGLYGEDGTIQGLFELLKIPYVGCGVLASSVGMDKVYTKIIFDKAGINQAKYVYIRKYNDKFIYVKENFDEQVIDIKKVVKLTIKKRETCFFKSRLPVSTIMARHLPQKRMCLISYYYLSSLQNHLRQPEQ